MTAASILSRPEGNWFFRRLFVYGLAEQLVLLVLLAVLRMPDDQLRGVTYALLGLLALLLTFYLIAPSATEIVRFVSEARPGLRLPGGGDSSGAQQ